MTAANQPVFDPSRFSVKVEIEETKGLRLCAWKEPAEDLIVTYSAKVFPRDDNFEPILDVPPIASIAWRNILYGEAPDRFSDLIDDWADSIDGEMYDLAVAIFGGAGPGRGEEPREATGFKACGNLLLIDEIAVVPEYQFQAVAEELIEHVAELYGSGFMGLAYWPGDEPPGILKALRARGFRLVRDEVYGTDLFLRDQSLDRPSLPGESE